MKTLMIQLSKNIVACMAIALLALPNVCKAQEPMSENFCSLVKSHWNAIVIKRKSSYYSNAKMDPMDLLSRIKDQCPSDYMKTIISPQAGTLVGLMLGAGVDSNTLFHSFVIPCLDLCKESTAKSAFTWSHPDDAILARYKPILLRHLLEIEPRYYPKLGISGAKAKKVLDSLNISPKAIGIDEYYSVTRDPGVRDQIVDSIRGLKSFETAQRAIHAFIHLNDPLILKAFALLWKSDISKEERTTKSRARERVSIRREIAQELFVHFEDSLSKGRFDKNLQLLYNGNIRECSDREKPGVSTQNHKQLWARLTKQWELFFKLYEHVDVDLNVPDKDSYFVDAEYPPVPGGTCLVPID